MGFRRLGGIGFLEIILIVVVIFFVFRFIRNRKKNEFNQNRLNEYSPPPYQQPETYSAAAQGPDQDVDSWNFPYSVHGSDL